MRPVDKSFKTGKDRIFKPWNKAKIYLVQELGSFCSYCEKPVNRSSLHIDHVLAKGIRLESGEFKYDDLRYDWNNFLLICSNCNSIKSNKDVSLIEPFFPHKNNLVHFILVCDGGLIKIKDGLSAVNKEKTQKFIDLVGLDREPDHPEYSVFDDRWENRLEAVDTAKRFYKKYTSLPPETDIETIIKLAKSSGYFSVWYYQFMNHKEVLKSLIKGIHVNDHLLIPFIGIHTDSFSVPDFVTVER